MYKIRMFLFVLLSFSFYNLNAQLSDNTKSYTKMQSVIQNKSIIQKQAHYKKTNNRFGNKHSFSSTCWRIWYNLRQNIVYPIDTTLYCLNCGQSSPVTNLRRQIYTQFLRVLGYTGIISDPAIIGMQCCVGIADAWAADKSTRAIVKEDIVAFTAFYAFFAGLDHLCEKVIMNETIMPSSISKIGRALDASLSVLVVWQGIKLLIKGYIATQAADIIAEPITCFMYDDYGDDYGDNY